MEENKPCRICNIAKDTSLMIKHNTERICKNCNSTIRKEKYNYKTRPRSTNGEYKTCLKCCNELHYSSFPKQKGGTWGVNSTCKKCFTQNSSKPINIERTIKWQKENKERINKNNCNRDKERLKTDIQYKIKKILRIRMWGAIVKRAKSTRNGKVEDLIGCSVDYYRKNIESQLKCGWDWGNYGIIWEIDHIIPLSYFDLTLSQQQKQAFNFKNTQPLSIPDNRRKSNKYNNG